MLFRFAVIALLAALASPAHAIPQDEYVIKTPFMSRTISFGAGILKTTKLEVKGEQILAQPSVEFMFEMDLNGEFTALVPSDFDVKSLSAKDTNRVRMVEIELNSKRDKFPVTVFVRYYSNPDWPYIEKTIELKPINPVRGATLRRIVIEDLAVKPEYKPTPGGFALVNAKSGKGIFYLTASIYGAEQLTRFGSVSLAELADQPVDSTYGTGRGVIGAGWAGADSLDQSFRDYVWNNYAIARQKKLTLDNCADVSLDAADPKQRAKSLAAFADKCREMRRQHPDQPLCLTPAGPVRPSDVHLLSAVDGIKVDLTSLTPEEATDYREKLLRVFPQETLRFESAKTPAPATTP